MGNQNKNNTEKIDILKMQYTQLMNYVSHQHNRWNDHWRTYLIILGILTTFLSATYSENFIPLKNNTEFIRILISIIGFVVSISGWISLNRIYNDGKLTFLHLRVIEKKFSDMNIKHISIFTNGKKFFKKGIIIIGDKNDLEFSPCRWLVKLKISCLAAISFLLFAAFFILTLVFE